MPANNLNYCPFGFQLSTSHLRNILRGVRGTPRKTVEIAAARALTVINDYAGVVKKDSRYEKVNKIHAAYLKTITEADKKQQAAIIELFPEHKSLICGSGPLYLDGGMVLRLTMRKKEDKLRAALHVLATDVANDYAAVLAKKEAANQCGIPVPTASVLKKVAKDPKLKTALDEFTKGLV